jgi:hypothetical protein
MASLVRGSAKVRAGRGRTRACRWIFEPNGRCRSSPIRLSPVNGGVVPLLQAKSLNPALALRRRDEKGCLGIEGIVGTTHVPTSLSGRNRHHLAGLGLDDTDCSKGYCSPAFSRFDHIAASLNLVLRSALARVSKDGHKRDRASGHPSRRRFAPPQDEVCVCLSSIRLAPVRSKNCIPV